MSLRRDPPVVARSQGLVSTMQLLPGQPKPVRLMLRALILALTFGLVMTDHARAATSMVTMFQDDGHLVANPPAALEQMRMAGATVVKVTLHWQGIAPNPKQHTKPRGFNGANPADYPAGNWAVYDEIVRDAAADHMAVDFQLGDGAPIWATGAGAPKSKQFPNWEPVDSSFWAFVKAAGIRYSGTFRPKGSSTPLPRVSFWSIWNEPNLGFELAPQGVPGNLTVPNSGQMYRGLVNAAWTALHQTGHGKDTILIGELGPRGAARWGVFAAMKPLIFMQALYCVNSDYQELRGYAAKEEGCPTTAAASRQFRAQNPGLFDATGLGVHLWARWYQPNVDPQHDPDYSGLPDLPHFEQDVDRLFRVYGSHTRISIYNTEFGYITNPPNPTAPFVSPATASYYLNWAEYISWKDPRIRSFSQYGIQDPPPPKKGPYNLWSSGLFTYSGTPKADYSAWRLPLYLPVTTTTPGRKLEVWGCVRPSASAIVDTGMPQTAMIQFAPDNSLDYSTVDTVTISSAKSCYFDVHLNFPGSGSVRLVWQYPALDPLLGNFAASQSRLVYSRTVDITVK